MRGTRGASQVHSDRLTLCQITRQFHCKARTTRLGEYIRAVETKSTEGYYALYCVCLESNAAGKEGWILDSWSDFGSSALIGTSNIH